MSLHLITGVAGQDGIFLARRLLAEGQDVIGTAREGEVGARACYLEGVDIVPLDIRDTDTFAGIVTTHRPQVVHNLAATSSVAQSWSEPETAESVNALAVEGMLDVLHALGGQAPRFVHASTSEIFGSAHLAVADANTPLDPSSPYGESKARAHLAVQKARRNGIDATNLVLFGHSGVLHAPHFVLPTIARQAAEVHLGQRSSIELRDPTIARDWGAADDFAGAFAAASSRAAGDYVIATGTLSRLSDVAMWALEALGTNGTVERSTEAPRPAESSGMRGDTGPAASALGWQARTPLKSVVSAMAHVALRRLMSGVQEDPEYLLR